MLNRGRVNLKNILLIFMILQLFFDSYVLYSDEVIDFFGFSPTTILRFLSIGIMAILIFFNKKYKDTRKPLIMYGVLVVVYTVLHHLVCVGIDDSVIFSRFSYNLMEELFYLLRLVYPIILAYIVYSLKLSREDFKFVIEGTSLVFALIIILLNLAGLSLTSYFGNYIKGNIFDWFFSDISRYDLASKGWFNSANQIGGLLLVIVPLMFYYTIHDLKVKDLVVFCLLVLSCFAVGTRISSLGVALVILILMIVFYLFKIIKKSKIIKREILFSIIIFCFSVFIFCYAPIVNCSGNNLTCILNLRNVVTEISNKDTELKEPDYDGGDVCEFLKETSTTELYYEKLYVCSDNLDFWESYVNEEKYKYIDNRVMEKIITEDVYSKVNSIPVSLFGMSRSRFLSAEIYLEKDIIVHYYTIGILGIVVFIVPYFLVCLYIGIKLLLEKRLNMKSLCLLSAILLPLVISVMGGHIIDELIVSLYIGFVFGYLISYYSSDNTKNLKEDKHKTQKDILFVVDENRMGGVSILLQDMLNIFDYNKYHIDVLVLHNSGECLTNVNNNVNIIYGTKFFEAIDYNLKDLIKDKKIKLIIKKLYIILLMKTGLIKYKIIRERKKILVKNYDVEIAFKDGFTAVFTVYGNSKKKIHWLHYEYKKYNANGNYSRLFNNILPQFDKIVAVSKNVMNDFNDIYHLENKTMVIGNLIDVDRIKKLSKEKCERKLALNKINIVCVGRLHPCKGYDRLINAISKLENNDKNKIHVEIYGDGVEKQHLDSLIKENHLENIVFLKGKVYNPYKYIVGNDLFILSSHFETFGLVIVEAMTLGVPVFALENSNTSNLIQNKVNGYIAKNDDEELFHSLKYLIHHRTELEKYKNNLKEYSYENDKIIKSIEELFEVE